MVLYSSCRRACKFVVDNAIEPYTWQRCPQCEKKFIVCKFCTYSKEVSGGSKAQRNTSVHVSNRHKNEKLPILEKMSPSITSCPRSSAHKISPSVTTKSVSHTSLSTKSSSRPQI